MNVIVSNRQKEIIDNANIDAIKDLNGLFNVSDLINKFKNYFFSKMILDATSVVDFASKEVLTTLANEIGAEKLIILLPSNPEPPLEFKKLLIELKIYNFTTSIDDVIKFIEKPNSYEDAMKLIDASFGSNMYVDNSIKEQDELPNEERSEEAEGEGAQETSVEEENTPSNTGGQSSLGDILNSLNFGSASVEQPTNDSNVSETTNEGFNYDIKETPEESTPSIDESKPVQDINQYENNEANSLASLNDIVKNSVDKNETETTNDGKNIFLLQDDFNAVDSTAIKEEKKKIIGVKNITSHAGSTSLIYMLQKLAVNKKKDALSVEIGKDDFRLFRDGKMISVKENELKEVIDASNNEIIFVDLNEYDDSICTETLYLVEPSTIKLNELMSKNRNIFKELKGKKVLLNKSLLSSNDIRTLESEAGLEFFSNVEPLNDRIFNDSIDKLLSLLDIK